MSQLVNDELQKFIMDIPDDEAGIEYTNKLFEEKVQDLSKSCGFCMLNILLLSTDVNDPSLRDIKEYVLLDSPNLVFDTKDQREIKLDLSNGGSVHFTAVVEMGNSWTEKMEKDFYLLAKILVLIYGRSRAICSLKKLMSMDAMTGVRNEDALYQFMGCQMASGKFDTYCNNFVNIKNMKLLNDRYGNRVGDQLMKQYAKKIEAFIGEDGCIARLGGDNFIVFIKKDKHKEFLRFMREMCVDLTSPSGIMTFVKIDSRVGYYYIQPGDDPNVAMSHSSIAFTQARRSRNADYVEFQGNMKQQMFRMRQLEDEIPDAIDNEEFVVYYQPKVMLESEIQHTLQGAEALVRWCKNGSMVSPGEFVPILEKNGMIKEIDFYVFERVCRAIKEWELKGMSLVRVSTNFSRRHLQDEDFADKVEAIIRKHDVNPFYLEVEITESYDDENREALSKFEHRMHELGVRLAMDDFGSGFSSLKMLKDMATDTIKLDKSIVDGVGGDNKKDEIIVAHMINLIKELGKDVIAEGVEYPEQAEFLRKNGCQMIQGFLFGKPMPQSEFEERLALMC